MNASKVTLFGLLLAGMLVVTTTSPAQQPSPGQNQPNAGGGATFYQAQPGGFPGSGGGGGMMMGGMGGFSPFGGGHSQSTQLAQQFVKAEKEETKREIRKKLGDVVNQQFDEHIKQQQKEVDELEKQIAHLRSVLRKRQDAKSTIVDRRIEQLIQEAEGLGWNVPSGGFSGNVFGQSGRMGSSGGNMIPPPQVGIAK